MVIFNRSRGPAGAMARNRNLNRQQLKFKVKMGAGAAFGADQLAALHAALQQELEAGGCVDPKVWLAYT